MSNYYIFLISYQLLCQRKLYKRDRHHTFGLNVTINSRSLTGITTRQLLTQSNARFILLSVG
jgi:hypothetical protein